METRSDNSFSQKDQLKKRSGSKMPVANFEELVRLCQMTGASKVPSVARALSFLAVCPDDPQLLEFVAFELEQRLCLDLVSPNPFRATNPTSQEELPGEIKLGFVPPYGVKWGIKLNDLCCHFIISSKSGGGKTSSITLILREIMELRSGSDASNIRSEGGF